MTILKLSKKTKELTAELCDRCARACDSFCRSDALLERARRRAVAFGSRVA